MSLPYGAPRESHLRGRHVLARREVILRLRAHEAARVQGRLGVGETPLHVGHGAVVSALTAEVVRVLPVDVAVRAAWGTVSVIAERRGGRAWGVLAEERCAAALAVVRLAVLEGAAGQVAGAAGEGGAREGGGWI